MSIEKNRLLAWKSDAPPEFQLLIDELITAYDFLDSERSQKKQLINLIDKRNKTIERLTSEAKEHAAEKDAFNSLSIETQKQYEEWSNAFKKLYSISNYGNALYKSMPLLKMWVDVEKMVNGTTPDEVSEMHAEVIRHLHELSGDEFLVDARNSLMLYEKFNSETEQEVFVEDKELAKILEG
jgi:hypothetical protein